MEKNKNILLETMGGDSFHNVSKEAFKIAHDKKKIVEFDFNGVTCLVGERTYPDLLYRDYSNAHLMDWKTIGPTLEDHYSSATLREMADRRQKREEQDEKNRIAMEKRDNEQKEAVGIKIKNQSFECINLNLWEYGRNKNKDPYGNACYEYAEKWAMLMQAEIENGNLLIDVASKTSFELGYMGISGLMYGAAVSILSSTWKHGEELRKWHNKDYGHTGDGVVNPAILTVG